MAANKPILLRCKTKSGQQILKGLDSQSTIADLCSHLKAFTDVPEANLKVLFGYPLKPLDLSVKTAALESVGLKSGDTLVIEESVAKTVEGFDKVEPQRGILMKHVVPADNSCLFTSIGYAVSGGVSDPTYSKSMRNIIAEAVTSDPETYNAAILGKSPSDYCKWIQNETTWGGAIEVAVLSNYYKVEIVVVNTQHVLLNRFGENQDYQNRILLMYDGIHYDPLVLEVIDGSSPPQAIFLASDTNVLDMALELAQEAKQSLQYTDVENFQLRCMICGMLLKGQIEAQQHAAETKHTNFGEIAK